MENISILGAGPAGLSAAISLAKAGYEVDVFERNQDVGRKFYGDLQGLENWSEKEDILDELQRMGLDTNFDLHPFSRLMTTNSLKTRNVATKRPLFYLIKRGTVPGALDLGLKKQAENEGVDIHFEESIPDEDADIVATGSCHENVVGMVQGISFKTDLKDTAVMLFNDQAGFRGYAYLLVTEGQGCLGTVVLEKVQNASQCLTRAKKILENMFQFKIQDASPCVGVGSFSLKNKFRQGETLYVGEAAGLQDFLWGFGLRYALKSGYLAAQCIIKGEDYKKDYEKAVQDRFAGKLKAGLVNRYLWEMTGNGNYDVVINNSQRIIDNLLWITNYNIVHRILYPMALRKMKERYGWL